MRQVFKIDSEGFYVEPVLIKEGQHTPDRCVEIKPTEGLFKAKLNDTQDSWVEGASPTDIALAQKSPVLDELEQLKQRVADLEQRVDGTH